MNRAQRALLGTGTAAAVTGLWEVADRTGWVSLESTARPSEIAAAARDMAADGEVIGVVLHSLQAFALSWMLAVACGTGLGIVLGLFSVAQRLLGPTVVFMRFVPPPALVPVVLLIWGFTMQSEVIVAAVAGAWPVVINATAGVRQVEPRLLDVSRALRLGRLQTVRKMVLPSALPMILVGARIASSVCLIVVVTVEILGVPEGIGHQIHSLSQAFRPDEAFVYLILAGVLGVVVNLGFRRLERSLLAWQQEAVA